jgi:hypothetical protein
MVMGIPSIHSGLRDDNPASLFRRTCQEGDVSKNSHPGSTVGHEEKIIQHRIRCTLISSVFGKVLDKIATGCSIYQGEDA